MNEAVHKVGSIKVHLNTSNEDGLLPFMDRVSKKVNEATQKSLEAWWEQYGSPANDRLQIDKISLDLGCFKKNQFIQDLGTSLDKQIRKQLDQLVLTNIQAPSSGETFDSPLFHFLHHGSLPWNCRSYTFQLHVEIEAVTKKEPIDTWIKNLKSSAFRKRLSFHINQTQLAVLLDRLAPDLMDLWMEVSASYAEVLSLQAKHSAEHIEAISEQLLGWTTTNEWTKEELVSQWWSLYQSHLSPAELKRSEGDLIHLLQKAGKANNTSAGGSNTVKSLVLKELRHSLTRIDETNTPNHPSALHENEVSSPSEYFLENAGIIILWPGYKHLFEATDLLNKRKFISKEAQEIAVQLLNYLHTAEEQVDESKLPLTKVLCGLDPAAVINPHQHTLTEDMKAVADSVRTEVHKEWGAPFSESEMISNFFYREGKLSRQENGWLLQIEKKPWDVLLDKLPWSIGIIQLPWTDGIIYTEW